MPTPKLSIRQKVYYYVKNHGEVSGRELEKQADEWFTNASTILRRARELAQDGTLEQHLSEYGTVRYKVKGEVKKPTMTTDEANAFLEKLRQETMNV